MHSPALVIAGPFCVLCTAIDCWREQDIQDAWFPKRFAEYEARKVK